MAPSAATAASRQRVSPWPVAVVTRAGSAGRWRRSPRNQAAPTTTRGSGSCRASIAAAGSTEREPRPRTPGAASTARRRSATDPLASATATSPAVSSPRRANAPRAAACTPGSGSPRPRRARAGSPRWPAMTSRRLRASARRSRRASVATSSLTSRVCPNPTRPPTGKPRRPPSQTPAPRWPPAGCLPRLAGAAPKRRKWPAILVAAAVLILVGCWIASRVSVDYYVLTPGDATPGLAVHRGPGSGQPSAHRQDPADRRLPDPAQRPELPAVPLLRLQQ